MKIAVVVTHFPALSETFVLNQITGLMDRGHTVHIHADRPGHDTKIHPDITRYNLLAQTSYAPRLPRSPLVRYPKGLLLAARHLLSAPGAVAGALNPFRHGRDAASLKLLYRAAPFLAERPAYDAIHAHFGQNGLRALALRELGVLRGPLLTTFHGTDMSAYLRKAGPRVYDRLLARGDFFLPISERWKSTLLGLGADARKIAVHRMGIDCARFQFRPRTLTPGQPARLLSIARLVEKKGIEYAIRAVAKVRGDFNLSYDIIGDGPLRPALEKLAREAGVAGCVRFLGSMQQEEVVARLEEAHVLIAPSVTSAEGDQEGIPVAMMEAMAMGLPILSTQHSGIPELVEDGCSGFLVPERDADALAVRLAELLAAPAGWPALGATGRQHVEQSFDINRLNDALVKIFHGLTPASRD